jgi:nitrogen-specific signal transduction histidine kinase
VPSLPDPHDAIATELARIGHELRNPLNGLCAALDVLAACSLQDAGSREAVEVARRQAQRLVQRVDDLLPRSGRRPSESP